MTDDPKPVTEYLRIMRISDGTIHFVDKDMSLPYRVGDIYIQMRDLGMLGMTEEKYIVLDDIKIKDQ